MKSTKKAKPVKEPALRPEKVCTRCQKKTRDWYPTTGGTRLLHIRCVQCYEEEYSRIMRDEESFYHLRKREQKETILK